MNTCPSYSHKKQQSVVMEKAIKTENVSFNYVDANIDKFMNPNANIAKKKSFA